MSDDIRVIKNDKLTDEQKKQLDGAPLLDPDTLDAALIGVVETPDGYVAAYDICKLSACFQKNGMSEDEAEEWVDYNTLRALPYIKTRAPWVLEEVSNEEGAANADDGENEIIKVSGRYWCRLG